MVRPPAGPPQGGPAPPRGAANECERGGAWSGLQPGRPKGGLRPLGGQRTNVSVGAHAYLDALEVGDRIGGLIQRIPGAAGTGHDLRTLQALMVQLKARFPDKLEASVLAEPDTPYDTLVQVMDAVRGTVEFQGPRTLRAELFPNISIGDAPVVKR